jgi:hypothetical protein
MYTVNLGYPDSKNVQYRITNTVPGMNSLFWTNDAPKKIIKKRDVMLKRFIASLKDERVSEYHYTPVEIYCWAGTEPCDEYKMIVDIVSTGYPYSDCEYKQREFQAKNILCDRTYDRIRPLLESVGYNIERTYTDRTPEIKRRSIIEHFANTDFEEIFIVDGVILTVDDLLGNSGEYLTNDLIKAGLTHERKDCRTVAIRLIDMKTKYPPVEV